MSPPAGGARTLTAPVGLQLDRRFDWKAAERNAESDSLHAAARGVFNGKAPSRQTSGAPNAMRLPELISRLQNVEMNVFAGVPGRWLAVFSVLAILDATAPVHAHAGERSVSAAEATGTWRSGPSEIKILPLGGGRLRVELALVFEYGSGASRSANMGDAAGVASIENDVAVFKPEESENCTITITFLRTGRLEVEQEGDSADCGFGHRVRADGTYRKVSNRKPNFGD